MTCFWNGTIAALNKNHMKQIFRYNHNRKPSPTELANLLKIHATETTDVLWNGQELSIKLLQENLDWIKEYDVSKIGRGHDTSICDPFLLLMCHLFKVNIIHDYNGVMINYVHKSFAIGNSGVLRFKSNRGHFWNI